MDIEKGVNVPIYKWCKELEKGALKQAVNLSSLPFIFNRVCLMPDCHQGYGMPIGGVIGTKGVVIPNAVGVDIGCGVITVQSSLKGLSLDNLKAIMSAIRQKIPLGFNHHKEKQEWGGFDKAPTNMVIRSELEKSKYQLGSLGGGNHFIELQKGSDGFIWIMIHSGSRNFGYKIAKHYNKLAQDLCRKWHSNIPPLKGEDGLAFFPADSNEGQEYLESMNFALEFAYANRKHMLDNCMDAMSDIAGCTFAESINIHHNYASLENHFGENVWVHRKGATSARKGEKGLIPGSQGTKSYVVEGLGNPESFTSCSHGAGRKLSRTKARADLNLEAEQRILEDQGILHSIRSKKDLDEATSAYKDIKTVMDEQKDLVNILVELTPLGVIKG